MILTKTKKLTNLERSKNTSLIHIHDYETTRFRKLIEILATSGDFTSYIHGGISDEKKRTK